MKSFSYFSILLEVFVLFAITSFAANQLQLKSGVYNLTWNYLPASQEIEFEVRVKTTGYVALGLTKTNIDMQQLDLFVGGVKTGAGFLKDYHANGESTPDLDAQQDFTLISATESNGITMVHCKRKLNTQDVDDFLIQAGDKVYFAWAYHDSSDDLAFHDDFGYSSQMHELVPLPTTAPPTTVAVTTPPSIAYNKEISFQNGDFNVFWKFDTNTNEIFFKLVVKATGYVGLGFSNTNSNMMDMDVVIAGVSGGQGYIGDYYSTSKTTPPRDTSQDYTLISATESGGTTTIEFKRRINTGDNKDLQIVPASSYYIGWAYHSTSDTLQRHSARGYSQQKIILVEAVVPSTTSVMPTTTSTLATTSTTSTIATPSFTTTSSTPAVTTSTVLPTTAPPNIAYNKEISFQNGDFNVFWKFDTNTNEIFFKLVVKATGYIGLGFSNTNYNMMDMDVVIAGVSGGQGYIGDYYSTSKITPPRDTSQDYTLISATESGGTTTIEFKRRINTGDNKDLQIVPASSYYIGWAYHSTSDTLQHHSARDYSQQKIILVEAVVPSTTSVMSTTTSTLATTPTTSTIATPSFTTTSSTPAVTTSTVLPTTAPPNIAYNKEISFQNGDFNVFWKFDTNTNEIFFKLVVKATGYIGLGFSNTNYNMMDMDVVIAGVSGGQGYIGDYYSTSKITPPRDTSQDYTLISATESGGTTTIEFKRRINTGDNKDLQIVPASSYYIGWAYHSTSDTLQHHSARDYSQQKIILVEAVVPSTTSVMSTTTSTLATTPTTSTIATPSFTTTSSTPAVTTSTVLPTTAPPNIAYNKEISFQNGDFNVFWKFDTNTNEIFFKLVVKATGYIGLGFSNTNYNMMDMDVVIAGVSGGQGYIGDYYSTSKITPPRDTSQDYTLISATESGGTTTIEFKRRINTGDNKDLQIVPASSYYIGWAYHSTSDTLQHHSARDYSQQKIILVEAVVPSTTSVMPTTTSTLATTPTTSTIATPSSTTTSSTPAVTTSTVLPTTAPPKNELTFKNGDFTVSWKYDSNTNEIFFKLVVKATGYVGFGFSNKNSDMMDMDVVIAGVSGGQGYIGDYFSTSKITPPRDTSQDYTLINATESGGTTTVEFKRKINTGDDKDLEIKPGASYYIAWACHSTSDTLQHHSERGYSRNKEVLVASSGPATLSSVPITPTTTKMTPTTSAVMTSYSVVLLTLAVCVALVSH